MVASREMMLDIIKRQWKDLCTTLPVACADETLLRTNPVEPGIWFLLGFPGAGKTTLSLAARSAGRSVVLLDEIRSKGGWTLGQPEFVTCAYEQAYEQLAASLARGTLLDSTGLWSDAREKAYAMANEASVPIRAVVVATHPEIAWERSLEKQWAEPDHFFSFALSLVRQLEPILHWNHDWTSVHWLDAEAQSRLYEAWDVTPKALHLQRSL